MPGLRFYGRRWQFGADDVTIPSFLCSLTRVTWVVLLSVFFAAVTRSGLACSQHVIWYTSFALGVYCTTLLVYLFMLVVSCRGTVLEVEKRWCMPGLFKLLTLCVLLETSMTIYGTYLATNSDDPCEDESTIPYDAMRAVVIGSWVDIFFTSCCGCLALTLSSADEPSATQKKTSHAKITDQSSTLRCFYWWGRSQDNNNGFPADQVQGLLGQREDASCDSGDENGDQYHFNSDEERDSDSRLGSARMASHFTDVEHSEVEGNDDDGLDRTASTWNRRCRRLCTCFQCFTCGFFGGMNGTGGPDAFQQVAVVLAGWFKNLELVPSDIVAALFLMRAEQIQMEANAVQALLRERQDTSRDRLRRRALTHVGRWMWSARGPNERATLRLHAQRIRESRDARRVRVSSAGSDEGAHQNDVSVLDPEARELLLFASDMAPFMLGMYGWFLFSYMHGIRGWLTLMASSMRRCCCRRDRSSYSDEGEPMNSNIASQFLSPSSSGSAGRGTRHLFVLDDGCCEFNTAALVERVGRRSAARADVVYASFATFGNQAIPYSVCIDHAKRRVVVAVRGIFTVADALANVTMVPAPLAPHAARWGFQDEIEADSHAHAGILRIAAWMREDLQKQDILHRLFGISAESSHRAGIDLEENGQEQASVDDSNDLPDCRGYELDITGHSLGGGVAVVLSLFLRPVFPNIRCMAFSPPGCIFDWKLANRCSSWVSCIFVGKDFAPRMSWHSLFKLRGQVLDTLRRDKATKFGAILSAIAGLPIDQLLYKPDQVPDSKHAREMEIKIDELANRRPTALDSVRLFAPGKLLHLMKDETLTRNCCSTETHYVPMWVDDRATLDEILLSTRLAFDHFPDVVDKVLQGVVHEYCQ